MSVPENVVAAYICGECRRTFRFKGVGPETHVHMPAGYPGVEHGCCHDWDEEVIVTSKRGKNTLHGGCTPVLWCVECNVPAVEVTHGSPPKYSDHHFTVGRPSLTQVGDGQ